MPPRKTTSAIDRSTLPPTFDRLRKKKPIEQRVTVYLDDEPIDALNDARAALNKHELDGDATRSLIKASDQPAKTRDAALTAFETEHAKKRAALEETVAEAEQAVRENTMTLVFRSIGRRAYDDLLREHPATDDDIEDAKKSDEQPLGYHVETFAPALIAASCATPKMTLEQACELFDDWNATELEELFTAALLVNNRRRVVELGKGRG